MNRGAGKTMRELADLVKKSTGTAMFLKTTAKTKVGKWVTNPKHRLHVEGEGIVMTLARIQELESLFEWDSLGATWEDRLSLLTTAKSTGTAISPEATARKQQAGFWSQPEEQYRVAPEGKTSHMTPPRIQVGNLGFEWNRFSCLGRPFERACHYAKLRHCNVLNNTAKQTSGGSEPKGVNTSCT
jgi:hypothetical protein